MTATRRLRFILALVAFALLTAACGDSDDAETTAAPETTEAATAETTTTEATTTTDDMADEQPAWEALYDGELVIGYVLPQTGGLSFIIPSLDSAINMSLDETNAAGNVNIKLISTDSGTDAQVASASVEQLINDEVDAIIGPAATGISLSVIDRITGSQIPMCSPSNTGTVFTSYDDGGYYFRTSPPDNLQGTVHADMITDDGASSVAIAYRSDEYGRGLAEAIQAQLENNGVSVAAVIEYDKDGTSFDAEAAQIAAAGVDAISLIGFAEGAGFTQALIEAGVGPADVPLYVTDGFKDSVTADLVDPNNPGILEGVRSSYPSSNPPDGEPTFAGRFAEYAPDTPTIFSAHSYDCATILVLAAESAGSTDSVDIAAAINDVTRGGEKCTSYASCHALLQGGADIDYDGASGPLDFVDAGEPGAGAYEISTYDAESNPVLDEVVSIP